MANRLALHQTLINILGSTNVYFQPPESVKINYPCIVYERSGIVSKRADNKNYGYLTRYTVTYITLDPDDTMIDEMLSTFQLCDYDRHFVTDNLNNEVFDLYY